MYRELEKIKKEGLKALLEIKDEKELENWRVKYFGKKGELQKLIINLKSTPKNERPKKGREINQLKNNFLDNFKNKKQEISNKSSQTKWVDPTLPSILPPIGHLHPMTLTINEIISIFEPLGYQRVSHPEIETDYFAFEALNMPKDHPARDEWETFFVNDNIVLTPHTSSGQVREMRKRKIPPIRMLNISRCYRRQQDVSHTPVFHQFEGLFIDEDVSIADLKGTLEYFTIRFFGEDRKTRIRPYHFQFTEPSFEVDISCEVCSGRGCKLCKNIGWLELGGAGMVHPNVLKAGGINYLKYKGFAFGWGVERILMMKTKINDIRLIYQNDIRFLEQF